MQTHRDGRFVLSCDSTKTLGGDGSLPKPCPEEFVAPEGATQQDSLALSADGGWATVGATDTCPVHSAPRRPAVDASEGDAAQQGGAHQEPPRGEEPDAPQVKQPGAGEAGGGTAAGQVATLTEIKEPSASQPEERVIPATPALEAGAVPA